MNGERGVLPAMGPAESLRRRLTSGLQGDSGETKLVPGNLSRRSRCQNWKDLRELLVQGPCYADAEIDTMELKVDENQMKFGVLGFFFVSSTLEQASGLRVKS